MPRTLAIGDIHGCLTALIKLADFARIQPDDLLVTLGDYVDRGPQSREVLDWLIARQKTGRLVALRGNHDVMFLDARFSNSTRDGWISVGGVQTLQSYGACGFIGTLQDVPKAHWEFIQSQCVNFHETERHVFVHAMLDSELPLTEQREEVLYWEKFRNPKPHCSGKVMVCGHTAQKTGIPLTVGHAICIDTWVYGTGWLTCLDVDAGEYWQANQAGETRRGVLGPIAT